ncbi:MAG: 50S ribosomal protein L21 [Betaproteobacteria bacterium]|nr:50S ribosomal protein L21 [Betaproteobacteria bacterium]
MFAVIKTGGKQYRVSAGTKLRVEQLPATVGQEVVIDQVLMVGEGDKVLIGKPVVAGANVRATVLGHGRADKIHIYKHRRRKHYKKQAGHRQWYSEIFIAGISDGSGGSATADVPAAATRAVDDLTRVEGIGPKIAQVLRGNGVASFADLAKLEPARITEMLKASGGRFGMARPDSWPQQAALAAEGKWDELKKLTDELVGGVKK